jgi:alpha-galactosidase
VNRNAKLKLRSLIVAAGVLALIAVAAARQSGQAAAFTGKWVAQTTANNATRETTYFLTQKGNTLTGAILTGYRMQDISEGAVNGNEATWAVVFGTGDQQRRIEYRATLDGDQLTISITGGRGRGGPLVAKKISDDGTPVGPFANLPKVALPALHNVSDGGVARTPPMGWNSWNHFKGQVDDSVVRGIADAMASNGMRDAGYVYVNIDDTWEGNRDSAGNIQPNSKFPDMKALADYVHSKGLKLGLYSSPGPRTCAGYEGSYDHEKQDAATWAAWGIDYVKYDWCSASAMFKPGDEHAVYQIMGDALRGTGRAIVFSLCQYGQEDVQTWGASVGGNLWRTTGDIQDNWNSMSSIGFDKQGALARYAGPGHWNDPDMMEVGNGGMTDEEYKTHFSLWAMLAAPLIAGNDVRTMSAETKDILLNKDVIAVDQDRLGSEGTRIAKNGDQEVWARPLSKGAYAIGLFNRGTEPAAIAVKWSDVKLKGKLRVRDLWAHSDLGKIGEGYSARVPPHGVVMLRIEK